MALTLEQAIEAAKKEGEGYYPNPTDITQYFRIIPEINGELGVRMFQCGPGTMYHPELVTCVHPWDLPEGYEENFGK